MNKEFVANFKPLGFRISSAKGEAFKKVEELHYFLRLHCEKHSDGDERFYFRFGVLVNSPFDRSYEPFENSIYLGESFYSAERTDYWNKSNFGELLSAAESIGLPWLETYSDLEELSKHILWRIDNGLRWYEPPQLKRQESKLSLEGQQVESLFGGPGDKICHNWVRRFYKSLAIVQNVAGNYKKAHEYINMYLEHISKESFRNEEIEAIQSSIKNKKWPKKS